MHHIVVYVMSETESQTTDGTETDELPHPQDNPQMQYIHEGKEWKTLHGDVFEIVKYIPDGPCGGIVVTTWVNKPGHPLHEHRRSSGGVSKSAIEEYITQYDGCIQTVNQMMRDIKNVKITDENTSSYWDYYYNQEEAQ